MKKLMSYIAVCALVLTFTACGNKDNEVVNNNPPVNSETNVSDNNEVKNELSRDYKFTAGRGACKGPAVYKTVLR